MNDIKSIFRRIYNSDFFKVLSVFILTRIIILFLGVFASLYFNSPGHFPEKDLRFADPKNVWARQDVAWYERISIGGYPKNQRDYSNKMSVYGFMPGYSYTIKPFVKVLGPKSFFYVASTLSSVYTLLAIYIMYRFYKKKISNVDSFLFLFLISAGSFYLSIPYTESLFILLVALTIYTSSKKSYLLAAVFAGLAVITRIQAVCLFAIPLLDILFSQEKIYKKMYLSVLSGIVFALPLSLFMLYLYSHIGSPVAFLEAQRAWGNSLPIPLFAFTSFFRNPFALHIYLHAGLWILFLLIALRNYKKIPMSHLVFCLGVFLISTSTETFYGTYRYVLPLFPIYAVVADEKPWLKNIFIYVNLILGVIFIFGFVLSKYFAI